MIARKISTTCILVLILTCLPPDIGFAQADQHAFLVGVDNYSIGGQLTNLKYPSQDVHQLKDTYLRSGVSLGNMRVMTAKMAQRDPRNAPYKKQIERELTLLLAQLQYNDHLLVAMSGHGVQYTGDDSMYFCPIDADLNDRSTLLSIGWLLDQLKQCAASTKIVLIDACRNDPTLAHSKSVEKIVLDSVVSRPAPVQKGGTVVIYSCSASQRSFEDPQLKGGIFFHYVNEGLTGLADVDRNALVSLNELEAYVGKRVSGKASNRFGQLQIPERVGSTRGNIQMLRVKRRSRPPTRQASTTRTYQSVVPAGPVKVPSIFPGMGDSSYQPVVQDSSVTLTNTDRISTMSVIVSVAPGGPPLPRQKIIIEPGAEEKFSLPAPRIRAGTNGGYNLRFEVYKFDIRSMVIDRDAATQIETRGVKVGKFDTTYDSVRGKMIDVFRSANYGRVTRP